MHFIEHVLVFGELGGVAPAAERNIAMDGRLAPFGQFFTLHRIAVNDSMREQQRGAILMRTGNFKAGI
ncbi:hypothetical protein [Massilia sp. TWR1-2-2]|uniref:hypothetical protein n=1 Tax=Massilia sp. TWR1-2-2 TaxID=2804584 RepID=UPI003CF6D4A7